MIVRAKSYIQALVIWLMGLGSFLPVVVFNLTDRTQAQGRVCPRGALPLVCLDTFLEFGMTWDGLHKEGRVRSGTQD